MGGCPASKKAFLQDKIDKVAAARALASSEYRAAMRRTQIRLNQNRCEKISSQFDFGCFSWHSLRFSAAVDVLTFLGLTLSDPRFVSRNVQNK
jgi:hypothetical protein